MLINFAKFEVIEGKMAEAIASAKVLSGKSLNDRGCREYTVTKNIQEENAIYVVEKWDDKTCLDEHMKTAHIAEFDAAAAGFLAAAPIVTTVTTDI